MNPTKELRKDIIELAELYNSIVEKNIDLSEKEKKASLKFEDKRKDHIRNRFVFIYNKLKDNASNIRDLTKVQARPDQKKVIGEIYGTILELDVKKENFSELAGQLKVLAADLHDDEDRKSEGIGIKKIASSAPLEIRSEIKADLEELERCFNAGCYRSSTILCGRLLETALHRLYYDATGNDLLEKSPGIGLGNMIAKLSEKNIALDPGLTQQIHLINQIRIFSVHKKKEAFHPNKLQAQAMMLYTIDVLDKIFGGR